MPDESKVLPADTPEPRGGATRTAWARQTMTAFSMLSADQREVLELCYFHRLSQTQVAERLGRPLTMVQRSAASGLRLLAASMDLDRPDT